MRRETIESAGLAVGLLLISATVYLVHQVRAEVGIVLNRPHRVQMETHEMSVTARWTSGGEDVVVTTTRGVAGPGETVDENETAAEWSARHAARKAAAEAEYPRD